MTNAETEEMKLRKAGLPVPEVVRLAAKALRKQRRSVPVVMHHSRYAICVETHADLLVEKIKAMIRIGFVPCGGVCFNGVSYMQAIYRGKYAKAMHTSSIPEG